jgi:hypothetical protein
MIKSRLGTLNLSGLAGQILERGIYSAAVLFMPDSCGMNSALQARYGSWGAVSGASLARRQTICQKWSTVYSAAVRSNRPVGSVLAGLSAARAFLERGDASGAGSVTPATVLKTRPVQITIQPHLFDLAASAVFAAGTRALH